LSAAYMLASEGFAVTIFESMDQPGGLLRYAIPEFRLPQKVLEDQINDVKSLGVEIRTDVFVGRTMAMSEIFMQGFSVVLLAMGAAVPDFADITGEELGGVYYAEEFLMRLQMGRKDDALTVREHLLAGDKTIVVGGGPAALDAARMALRMGQEVRLVFPGLEEQLDVHIDDLKAAIEEGVVLDVLTEPLSIVGNENNFATGLQCRRLEIKDNAEGLVLETVSESDFTVEAQTVVLAHGRKPNAFLKDHLPQLKFNDNGTLWIDAQSGQTNMEKIFACGNVATGAGPVVDAIASGKTAAANIMGFLSV
jgi:glutamate synthase (NADPH/NADH) small chain